MKVVQICWMGGRALGPWGIVAKLDDANDEFFNLNFGDCDPLKMIHITKLPSERFDKMKTTF